PPDSDGKIIAMLRNMGIQASTHLRGEGAEVYLRKDDIADDGTIKAPILELLKELTKLRYLSFSGTPVGDRGLAQLKEFPDIEHFSLGDCKQITDAGLSNLKHLKALRILELNSCSGLHGTGLADLKGLAKLEYLDLTNVPCIDVGLKNLSAL